MDQYIKLAKDTLENFFSAGELPVNLKNLPKELLHKKAGVFVTLYKKGRLRGCIGTFTPTTPNVASEIRQNAISSAMDDPRFLPLEKVELPDLKISVDVLNPPELIKDLSELDPHKYGVIVENGSRRGLLLPDLEGVATVSEQLAIACQKAGIDPDNQYKIYKFTVTRHE